MSGTKRTDGRSSTTELLEFLLKNGPQTARQLAREPFWGGVRTRMDHYIAQGRVIKCEVVNPDEGPRLRTIVTAYKVPDDVFTGILQRKRTGPTARQTKESRGIARAKAYLEEKGYTVTPPKNEVNE